MTWRVEFDRAAEKALAKIGKADARRIASFIDEHLIPSEDPRSLGKPLSGSSYRDVWRFLVSDYRLLARIRDEIVTIIVLKIGHRSDVYRERR